MERCGSGVLGHFLTTNSYNSKKNYQWQSHFHNQAYNELRAYFSFAYQVQFCGVENESQICDEERSEIQQLVYLLD